MASALGGGGCTDRASSGEAPAAEAVAGVQRRAAVCGNGVLDMGEACDGADVGGNTCSSLPGLASGTLRCRTDCQGFDVSACHAGVVRAAATCGKADVTAQIAAASDGDTITVPAGTCNWGALTLSKGVVLQGAGAGKTIITVSTLEAAGTAGRAFRITGFTIKGGDPIIRITGSWRNFRIDHSTMTSPTWVTGILVYFSAAVGVIDRDSFRNARTEVYGEGDGSPSWLLPSAIGTGNAVYLETSTSDWTVYGNAIDSTAGGRWVLRHNTIYNTPLENHGPCTSGMRGTRSYEIYGNTLIADSRGTKAGITYRPFLLRGGTGVVYDNVVSGPWSSKTIQIDSQRSCVDANPDLKGACGGLWASHPQCDGAAGTKYDGALAAQGYPCRDQLGRSTDQGITTPQLAEPLYFWNNKVGNADLDVIINPAVDCAMTDVHVQEGRDYFTGVQRPDYRPYPYPHPLVQLAP